MNNIHSPYRNNANHGSRYFFGNDSTEREKVKAETENRKVKAASKRAQRKSLLLLCRAGAGSSAQSAVKKESNKPQKRVTLKGNA